MIDISILLKVNDSIKKKITDAIMVFCIDGKAFIQKLNKLSISHGFYLFSFFSVYCTSLTFLLLHNRKGFLVVLNPLSAILIIRFPPHFLFKNSLELTAISRWNPGFRKTTEFKQRRNWSVPQWVISWEY